MIEEGWASTGLSLKDFTDNIDRLTERYVTTPPSRFHPNAPSTLELFHLNAHLNLPSTWFTQGLKELNLA